MTRQVTLAGPAEFAGVGIHTGEEGRVRVCPAPTDYGVRFVVASVELPAVADYVVSTQRCTVLGTGQEPSTVQATPGAPHSVSISTVEHLMAALYGLGIDNARVEVEGPEIPILDGSAAPFAEGLLSVGLRMQDATARLIRLSEPIWLQATGAGSSASILALPADRLTVTAATDFGRPGEQEPSSLRGPCVFSFATGSEFVRELASARTFCFQEEVAALLKAGIGLGGSVENTVVISDTGTSTPLRFADEMTRHKVLDLLGDLALVGGRLAAHVIAMRAGHTLHVAMARALRQCLVPSA